MYGGPLGALMRQIVRLPIIWDGRTDGGGFSMSLLLPPDAALAFSAYPARARGQKSRANAKYWHAAAYVCLSPA